MSEYSDHEISEAEEVIGDDLSISRELSADDDGEDLIHDRMEEDYLLNPEDDQYDRTMLDETVQEPTSREARARAEAELRARDEAERNQRAPTHYDALIEMLRAVGEGNEGDTQQEGRNQQRAQRHRRVRTQVGTQISSPSPQDVATAKEDLPYHVPHRLWDKRLDELFKILFHDFIMNFTDVEDCSGIYLYKLLQVIKDDSRSLGVKFDHLVVYLPKLGEWIVHHPVELFSIFDSVVTDEMVKKLYPMLYREYGVQVRLLGFTDFIEPISDLKVETLNMIVACEGVVLRRGGAYTKLKELYIECRQCGEVIGPVDMRENALKNYRQKTICPREGCSSTGPFFVNRERLQHKSTQNITIQEFTSSVQPGRIPRQKEILVEGDLVDKVRPGDEVQVIGFHQHQRVAELNARTGFPVVKTQLLANNLIKKSDVVQSETTAEDIALFHNLAKKSNIRDRIISSIAPSIWGHRHAKTALAMAVFGGVRRDGTASNKHSIRGDINVLLLGDPGMAKSQFLKYINSLVEKSVFTTGKGASATGLTASMKKDPSTGEYILEGGALVLADNGICLIDEFDKMSDHDRVSIHEAMECQTISISKAGICTSLRARCSVVAAANPVYGKYDSSLSFAENVTLGDTILSRFDVMAVMKNTPTIVYDEYLASYVLGMHKKSHPDVLLEKQFGFRYNDIEESLDHDSVLEGTGPLPQSILKKYIAYARSNCYPSMKEVDHNKVTDFYAQVRQASKTSGGLSLTVRHLESILRMSYANAKIRLSNRVTKVDIDYAIGTLLESFIQSQKCAVATTLSKRFGRYRALANSPNEILETLISDVLNKRIYSALSSVLHSEDRHKVVLEDAAVIVDEGVDREVLASLAKSLYGLNDHFVENYIDSHKFKNKFLLRKYENKTIIIPKLFEDDAEIVNVDYMPSTQMDGGIGDDTQGAETQMT